MRSPKQEDDLSAALSDGRDASPDLHLMTPLLLLGLLGLLLGCY